MLKDAQVAHAIGREVVTNTELPPAPKPEVKAYRIHIRACRRIAFFYDLTGKYEIWTINPDGSDRRQLTFSREDQPGYLDPAWSRDGTRMLFSYRGGGGLIMDLSRSYQEQELFTFPPPPDRG